LNPGFFDLFTRYFCGALHRRIFDDSETPVMMSQALYAPTPETAISYA